MALPPPPLSAWTRPGVSVNRCRSVRRRALDDERNESEMYEWLRPTKNFPHELFRRLLPFDCWERRESACVSLSGPSLSSLSECLCAFICMCVYSTSQASTWQALSQMSEAGKGTPNRTAASGRLCRGFHKDRSQQVLLSYLALSRTSFMQLLPPFGSWQC